MKTKYLFFFLFVSINIFSQREADYWYFGNKAGLHFNKGKIDILNDSKMNTIAGSASISDIKGNLLLYTNGQTVWNKNHQIIENGNDLIGEPDNSQTSIIIPKPNSTTNFYIFTPRQNESNNPFIFPGIYYSEIEISNTFPNGKVIIKNVRLENSIAQQITAVHHKNGKDIWVITHGSKTYKGSNDIFFSFKVTEHGVNSGIKTQLNAFNKNMTGQMKASPDGNKVAITGGNYVYIYKFNNTTGILEKYKSIFLQSNFTEGFTAYGLSFSPNSKLLYYPSYNYLNGVDSYNIMQVELEKLDSESDYVGESIFKTLPGRNAASIQLASDGKIYVGQIEIRKIFDNDGVFIRNEIISINNIGIINEPNKLGENANYTHDSLILENGFTYWGLPNFIQSYFRNRIITENKCVSDIFDFNLDAYRTISNAKWDFGDGNYDTGLFSTHKYSKAGSYIVTCKVTIDGVEIPFYKEVTVFPLPEVFPNQELIQCDTNNDGIDYFDLNDINDKVVNDINEKTFVFFRNKIDAEKNENSIKNPEVFQNESVRQELFVKVISDKGCGNITNFFIESKFVSLGKISSLYSCDNSTSTSASLMGNFDLAEKRNHIKQKFNLNNNETIRFYPSLIEAQTTSNLLDDNFISPTSTIFVRVDTNLGCGGIEPFNLVVNSKPIINIQDSYIICVEPSKHTPLYLEGNSFNDRFEWRNSNGVIISTDKKFLLNTIGNYNLTAYKTENNIECSSYKEFKVSYPDAAVFNQIDVDTETDNNIVSVSINGNSNYEFSLDNKTFFGNGTNYTFTNVIPGLRTIYVKDINNCEPSIQTNASVIGFNTFFTPNGDGSNDYWNLKGLDSAFFKSVNIIVFDRFGKILFSITDFNSKGWDGTYNGKILNANDYWFKASIIDLNDQLIEKSGNFSLIRN